VQTSAAVPLISMRPFTAAKWSAWLVPKIPPVSQAPCPVTLNLQHILPHPCRRLLTDSTQKTLGYTTLCSDIVRRPNKRAGMQAAGQVGSATGGQ